MSQAISSLNITTPPLIRGSFSCSRPNRVSLKANGNGSRYKKSSSITAKADQMKDNLDHLQRQTNPTNPKPNKRLISSVPPPLGLWVDRFPTARTMQQMMETMENIIEDPFAYSGRIPSQTETTTYSRGRTPWDIKEAENEFKMRFDMPGMTKQDVKVSLQDKTLIVKAEKDEEKEEEEWSAKSYGRYSTRIALPENIQFDKIKAEVKDGVLYITIPKAHNTTGTILDINVA